MVENRYILAHLHFDIDFLVHERFQVADLHVQALSVHIVEMYMRQQGVGRKCQPASPDS